MIACEQGYHDIVQVFIKYVKSRKINVNAIDDEGMTALMFSCGNGLDSAVNLLLQADIGIEFNKTDHRGRTAMHWACIRGQARVVDTTSPTKKEEEQQQKPTITVSSPSPTTTTKPSAVAEAAAAAVTAEDEEDPLYQSP